MTVDKVKYIYAELEAGIKVRHCRKSGGGGSGGTFLVFSDVISIYTTEV